MTLCIAIGGASVQLRRYEKDARSIPVIGDRSGQIDIGIQSSFTIVDTQLLVCDPENGSNSIPVGTHLQYLVNPAEK